MNFLRIVKISRPLGWVIAVAVYFVGLVLSKSHMGLLQFLQILTLTLPFCFFLYGINDIYDYDSDKINPRKGNYIYGAKIKKNEIPVIKSLAWIFVLPFVIVASFINFYNLLYALILVLVAYFYSAPPLRFKEIPFVETISNSFILYLVVVLGYTNSAVPWQLPYQVYFFLLVATGFNAYHTIVDFDSDLKAGHKTFGTRFGKRATAGFSFLCCLIAFFYAHFESLEFRAIVFFATLLSLMTVIQPKIAKWVMPVGFSTIVVLVVSWIIRTYMLI
ncbi:UbiA family prenyltransferase [Candidatus Woesearchaeota archaeon]|nr:UbiA family prenyltransferase [Candidatus Woesearchaeota archaeon]